MTSKEERNGDLGELDVILETFCAYREIHSEFLCRVVKVFAFRDGNKGTPLDEQTLIFGFVPLALMPLLR